MHISPDLCNIVICAILVKLSFLKKSEMADYSAYFYKKLYLMNVKI